MTLLFLSSSPPIHPSGNNCTDFWKRRIPPAKTLPWFLNTLAMTSESLVWWFAYPCKVWLLLTVPACSHPVSLSSLIHYEFLSLVYHRLFTPQSSHFRTTAYTVPPPSLEFSPRHLYGKFHLAPQISVYKASFRENISLHLFQNRAPSQTMFYHIICLFP